MMFTKKTLKIFSRVTAIVLSIAVLCSGLPAMPAIADTGTDQSKQKITTTSGSLNASAMENKKTITSVSGSTVASQNNDGGLSQEEINKIVNDHFNKGNSDPTTDNTQKIPDNLLPDNQKTDRFIIKYKDENQKDNTFSKMRGNLKQRKFTRNRKFDVYITSGKMKKDDFSALLRQKQADWNVEYIQPDYQVTVASVDPAQTDGNTATSQALQLSSSTFDGLKITLTYNASLNSNSAPAFTDFTVTGKDGSAINLSDIVISGSSLVLTLSAPLASGEPVILSYTPGTNPIEDNSGNQATAISSQEIASSIQTTPTLVKAEGQDNTISLQYNVALDTTSVPDIIDFTLTCKDAQGNAVLNGIQNLAINNHTLSLTLSTKLLAGENIRLSYTPSKTPLKDQNGNLTPAFNNQNVTINQVAIALQAASVNSDQLELDFSATLKTDELPDTQDFSLTVNGNQVAQAVKSCIINGQKVLLTLNTPVISDDQVQIGYTPGTNPLQDINGIPVAAVSGFNVTNLTQDVNDTLFGQEWGFLSNLINQATQIAQSVGANIVNAWKQSQGENVTVAVIDTGIDITHEDLKDNIWTNTKEIAGNGTDDDNNSYVDDIHGWNFVDNTNTVYDPANASDEWHGTHVAGIIAAELNNKIGIAGVAPKAKIMPLQVFKNGTAYTSDIISAINYAKQNGAQIINCSWGTTSENTALKEAVEESGLIFVCAAGNSNRDIDANPVYPASLTGDNIISVASVNKTGNLSHFSNYGANSVDVAAPGEDILSTAPGNTYKTSGGTSQAAAFVSGEVALILSKYPSSDLSQIRSRVINSCDRLSSLTGKVAAGGIINCSSALADPVLANESIIQVSPEPTPVAGDETSDNGDYNLYSVDEWNTKGSLQGGKHSFGAVALNDKIYCIGGYNGSYLNSVEIYDPVTGTSSTAANMSTYRYGLAVAVAGGKIYAIGGTDSGGYGNRTEVYDPVNNTWSRVADLPTGRNFLGAATVNGIIYAIGGSALNTVEAYDPATNTWSTKASMPTARSGLCVVAYNGKIYAIGGYNGGYKNIVEKYDPITDTWTTKASMPIASYYSAAAVNGSNIYVIGGHNGDCLKNVYEYMPDYDVWGQRADLITARYGLGAAAVNGKVYALGGCTSGYNPYTNTVEEYGLPSSKWKSVTNLTTARSELGAASVNGKVYAIGGYTGSTYLNTVEEYNQSTNTWSAKTNMITARKGFGVAALNGLIYTVGGYNGSYLTTVEVFNPATNTWATKASLPSARAYFGLTAANGKLYAIGGYNGTTYLNSVTEYDPVADTWTTKADMTTLRGYLGLTSVNGRVYVIGGYNGTSYLNTVEVFDPVGNTWISNTAMPTARRGLGVETVNGQIYAIGGYNGSYLNTVEQFNPNTNQWTSLNKEKMFISREKFGITSLDGKIYTLGGYNGAYCNTAEEYTVTPNPWAIKQNMPTARAYFGAVAVNGKVYAIGGSDSSLAIKNTVEVYDPVTNTWSTKASMPTARYSLGITALDGKIYAIGGYNGTTLNTVEVYDPVSDTWNTKASMPTARLGFGIATLNGKIYTVGGYNSTTSQIYNIVEVYNPATNTWSTLPNMPTARYALAASAVNGKIYAIGGFDGSKYLGTVEEYNPSTYTWSTKASMPTIRENLAAVAVNGKVYALGGDSGNTINKFEEYTPTTNTWCAKENLPFASQGLGVTETNGKIYALGGCTNNNGSLTRLNAVLEYDLGTIPWETKASMPKAKSGMGIAAVNGIIYSLGGDSVGSAEKYDPATNSWTSIANMPTARYALGAVAVNGQVYAIGGCDYSGNYLNTVEVYDPVTNTWSSKANMTISRSYLGVAAVNGKIYAIGGYWQPTGNNPRIYSTVEEYDPVANTWTSKADMPTARYAFAVAVVDSKIYAIGGHNGNAYLNIVEVFDPATNTWSTKASMLTSRYLLGAGVANDKIYVLGGYGTGALDTNEEYDPVNNSWSVKSGLPTARSGLGVTAVNGKVYAIGGSSSSGTLQTVEVYNPTLDVHTVSIVNFAPRKSPGVTDLSGKIYAMGGSDDSSVLSTTQVYSNNTWTPLTPMPTARKDLGLAAVNGRLYAVGGSDGTSYLNTVEEYNPVTDTWSTKTGMPTARSSFGIAVVSSKIYVIGGYNGSALNTVEVYDPATDTWNTQTSMPTNRYALSAVNLNGVIYAMGGQNSSSLNTVEEFDPISGTWSSLSGMPTARNGLVTATVKGKIYALGGYDGNNYLSIVEEYNPGTKGWSAKTALLNPRAYFGSAVLGDQVYLVGGSNSNGLLNITEEYNPGTITWSTLQNMPTGRTGLGVVAQNGEIYAVGGYNNNSYLSITEEFNTVTNSWPAYTLTGMPTARKDFGIVAVNSKIYVIGGYSSSGYLNTVEEYNRSTNTWSTKLNMPTARAGLGVVTLNGKLYAIGGYNSTTRFGTVEIYDPTNNSWSTAASMPTARGSFGTTTVNGNIFVIGGENGITDLNTVEQYDPVTNTWSTDANMLTARKNLGAAAVDGKIYALGGYVSSINSNVDTVEVYDPATNTWQVEASLPYKTSGFGTATVDGKIYIIGGSPNSQSVLVGSFEQEQVSTVAELIHLGEENVNPSGNFARTYTDMSLKIPGFTLDITRTYNSRDGRTNGPLGKGWSFGFQGSLTDYLTNQRIARLPNGSAMTFTKKTDGTYTANDSRSTLVKQADNSFILTTKDQYTYGFNTNGLLTWMKDRNGNTITLTVNATTGNVTQITDQVGRQFNITYDTQGLISYITDPLGRNTVYQYTNNQLTRVIDPAGKSKYYVYNTDGLISEIRDNDNNLIESVVYDTSAGDTNIRIARLTDAYGNTSTYMYDTEERKVKITDSNGVEKITWYDSSLYPIQTQDPDGRRSTVVYTLDANGENKFGEAESVTDRNGNKTEYVRDSNGNITTIYNPDSSAKSFGYDSKNNKIWEKDEGDQVNTTGKYTYYIYDANNINVIKKAQRLANSSTPEQYIPGTNDADFAVTSYTYYTSTEAQQQFGCNISGLLKTVTDPNGHITTYTYDTYGNIHTVTDGESKITTYTYNNIGWKTSELSAKGYTTSYVYDLNGNLQKTTLNGGEVTRITHDNMGRQTKVISANLYNSNLDNLTTDIYSGDVGERYTYYSSGKVHTHTDSEGNTTTYTYDLYGNVQTETKPNGSIIQYFYDNLDRLTAVKFQDNSSANPMLLESLTYLILSNGNTQKTDTKYLNDTDTAVTVSTFDYAGRLIRQDNPDGTYSTISYNANGTVNHTTDERGYSTYYRYDGLNRITEQWVPSATDTGNTLYSYINNIYDNAGNGLSIKTGKTNVALYSVPTTFIIQNKTYYNNNKLKSETDSSGSRIDYFYDNDWNLSEKDVYTGVTTKNVTEYINNYFGKPATVKLHVRAGDLFGNSFTSNTDTVLTTTYTFDKNGNILTETRPDNVVITYTYDNLDRQTGTSMPGVDENNTAVTITTSSTYDWAGKVLTKTDANNHTTINVYDQRERLIKITDAKNKTAAYYYDRAGRLIAEVAPKNFSSTSDLSQMSRTTYTYDNMDRAKTKGYTYIDPETSQWVSFTAKAYKYDQKGNKIKELDALGFEAGTGPTDDAKINSGYGTQYTYDPANRVLTVLDPVSSERSLSYTTQYAYDGVGRKINETNANGIVTAYTYDDVGNLLTKSINSQTVKTNTYDTAGNLLTETDGNNNTVTYAYNAFYKLMQAVYPGDSTIPVDTVTCQYDTNGNLKQKSDSAGPVDLYTYDNLGRELSHTQQKNDGTQSITTSARYDKAGNKRFMVDGNGVTTENTYNEINQLVSSIITVTNINNVATQQTTTYGYDANGNPTTKTDWLGNVTTNVYDPLERLIQKIDPLNKTIEKLAYNHNSVQITSTDALNKVTQYTYDKNNRKLSTIDPLNHTNSQTYDNAGNVHTKTDGEGNVTTFNYDAFNRLTSVVNAKSETTSYTYDVVGNKLTQTDGLNHTTTFEYNVANKLTKKIDHGGRTGTYPNYVYNSAKTESYSYDADGNLISKVDRNGYTTSYTYDVHGRMLSQVSSSQSVTYTYDGNGNQLTMVDSTGTTTRIYDELNRTKSKTVPGGVGTLTFLFDVTTGLPSGQVAETDTDPKNNVTTKVFDKAGRMISVTSGSNTTTYTYNDNGSKASVVYPDGSNEVYTYYDDGTLNTLVNKKSDQTVIDSYAYTYDSAKNMLTKVDAKGTTTYTYDELNRLETVTEPSTKVSSYTFDAAGNRLSQTETLGAVSTVMSYTYNEQNRLTDTLTQQNGTTTQTGAYTYDNNGNQLTKTITPYVGGIPQTPEVTTSTFDRFNQMATIQTPDGTNIINTYNGEGLRVSKQVGSLTTKYVYVGDKVVLELDGSNNQVAFNVQGTTLISRTVGGSTLYVFYNGHADVTALLDSSGTIQARFYYDAFGNILEKTGSVNNPYTFSGYAYDEETGYYYLQSRYYDPIIARFLSEDTYSSSPGDFLNLNKYLYCHNEPIMYSDPNGHWSLWGAITSAASYVSSAVSSAYSYASSAVSSAVSYASSKVSSAKSYVSSSVSKAVSTVSSAVSTARKAVSSGLSTVTSVVKSTAAIASSAISSAATAVSNKVTSITSTAASSYSSSSSYTSYSDSSSYSSYSSAYTGYSVSPAQALGMVAGLVDAGSSAVSGIANMVAHPIQTAESIGYAVTHLGETATAISNSISTAYNEQVINGDEYSSGKFMGRVLGEVALAFVGTKGIDKVAKIAKGTTAVREATDIVYKANTAEMATTRLTGAICFTGATLIVTKEGYKQIKDIQPGDQVLSENIENGEKGYKQVKQLFVNDAYALLHISIKDTIIKTTFTHPFYVVGKGWVEAKDLRVNDVLKLANGETTKVEALEAEELEKPIKVYNFEVEDWHTYFVSEYGVLVHNTGTNPCSAGASAGKIIPDEAFVRFDPTNVRGSISNSGIQSQFFADEKVWVTKYKYAKDISNPTDLETILYNKNIQPFTQGKFSSGADLYYLKNIDDAVAAGKTNMANGIPQWRITRDIPTNDIELIKTLNPYNK